MFSIPRVVQKPAKRGCCPGQLNREIYDLFKETEGAGLEELLRNAAAQEGVTIDEREGDVPSELLEEPATKRSVAEKLDAMGDASPEEMLRNAVAQDDGSANDDLDTIHKRTKDIHEPIKSNSEDMDETENAKEPLRDNFIQDCIDVNSDLEEIHEATKRNYETAKVEIGETEDAGPEEMPGNAAQEDVTTDDTGRDDPGKLKKPDTETPVPKGSTRLQGEVPRSCSGTPPPWGTLPRTTPLTTT